MSQVRAIMIGLLRRARRAESWEGGLWIAVVIFAAALFGIFTRPIGLLAAIWPANALLMGIFIRKPQLALSWGLAGALIGYGAADLLTGSGLFLTLWLTIANMASAYTGFFLFRCLSRNDQRLKQPLSVLYMFLACLAGAVVAGLVACYSGPLHFKRDAMTMFVLWATTEFANNTLLLPLMLSAPSLKALQTRLENKPFTFKLQPQRLLPATALMASVLIALVITGPGAIVLPLPALLWCALTYDLFTVSFLTMMLCWAKMTTPDSDLLLPPLAGEYFNAVASMRLGVAIYALAPLTVAIVNLSRNEFVKELEFMAIHDYLTRALSRRAFTRDGNNTLNKLKAVGGHISMLVLDIDHFKSINDGYGHAAGDSILVQVSQRISKAIRQEDLFGRIGGEEFAVLLPMTELDEAQKLANRILDDIAHYPLRLEADNSLQVTVSIGLACFPATAELTLEGLIKKADTALYKAKIPGGIES